jgi:hypothetical protein
MEAPDGTAIKIVLSSGQMQNEDRGRVVEEAAVLTTNANTKLLQRALYRLSPS